MVEKIHSVIEKSKTVINFINKTFYYMFEYILYIQKALQLCEKGSLTYLIVFSIQSSLSPTAPSTETAFLCA